MEGALTVARPDVASLARSPDWVLGDAVIRPSLRAVQGPEGSVAVEPRVMQVLLLLAEAGGSVVSREDIHAICWGGIVVGDDSLNRAVAEIRRAARSTGSNFSIETIPRVGYRLVADPIASATSPPASDPEREPQTRMTGGAMSPRFARRQFVGLVSAVGAAGAAYWGLGSGRDSEAYSGLMAEGRRLLRESWPGTEMRAVELFKQAIRAAPGDASAWGLLAVAWRDVAEEGSPTVTSSAVAACEAAASRALALDPEESNALAALASLHPYFGDWGAAEDRFRHVLKIDPVNPTALSHIVTLLQSVGRARDSWIMNERALASEPLSPPGLFRKALKHWIFGDNGQADLTIDRALQLWPRHPGVWNARLYLFAFTGRTDAARKLIEDHRARPVTFTDKTEEYWRIALAALAAPTTGNIGAIRRKILEETRGGRAVPGIMILSALRDLDAAFAVAEGFLLRKGPLVASLWPTHSHMMVNDQGWRRTMNLFTPATAAMRRDARFAAIAQGIGLTRYWRERGTPPDAFLGVAV